MGDEVKLYSSSVLISSATIMTGKKLTQYGNDSMFVSSGGTANSTTVSSGGHLNVSSGGMANSTTVKGGYVNAGYLNIYDGGVANSTTVNSYGYLNIYDGGVANSTIVNSYGQLNVSSGGTANRTAVNSNGWLVVYSGGVANSTTVNSRGYLCISSGGTAAAITALSGAELHLTVAPDTYIQGTCNGSAFEMTNAYISGYTVTWGSLDVSSGGTANSTTVNAGGALHIYSGGTALSIKENGGYVKIDSDANVTFAANSFSGLVLSSAYATLHSGTTANKTTISSGGLYVESGGIANSTTIKSGGHLYVKSAGTANNTTVDYMGGLWVYSGGTANSTTVSAWCGLYVLSSGTALSIKENGGYVSVGSGATVTFIPNALEGLKLFNNATLHSGTTANSTTVNSGGSLTVFSGGVANSTTVNSGGRMFISSGGMANSTTVNSGASMSVSSDGTAHNTTVSSDGDLTVWIGGAAQNVVLKTGGRLGGFSFMEDRTLDSIVNGSAEIASQVTITGRTMSVSRGGTANYTTVSGGSICVFSGGTANYTTVSGGSICVFSGGVANSTTVNYGGCLYVSSGGTLSGTLQIASGAIVAAYSGAIVDFTVAEQEAPDTALINNWSLIYRGAYADYTITVLADQTNGTYCLADGAADFANTITVKTTAGDQLGTLAVGETKTFNDINYTLSKNADALSLSIFGAVVTNTAKSDVDGNNISDVMFQYTGGDYQIGFWMNGSSTWQGTGASQPANWELLGAYDMDSSGMADQVMFGNVLGGAYIGYYKDGDTTSGGWQNIGYLNNPDEIKWDNVIGNLTGNAGQNSIVWHAAELGAVGVWTDGTSNWVSIDGYYGTDWELQGTGDFNGDGKDEILFSNAGNLYTVDLDSNFVSLGDGWGEEWQVRAIGDFSGDGTDDIVLFHKETGSVVKFSNGQSSDWESLGQLDASDWFIVGAGDYDNDQQDDLLVRQYSTGMLGYYSAGDMSKWNEMGRGVDMNWTVIA